jgi:hypothetical protein
MKKLFPILLIALGIVFAIAGGYTVKRGLDAKAEVRDALIAQHITTPQDASMPNVEVTDIATARSMADIIDHHSLEATKGKTYSEMGRYLAKDGTDTNDATNAVVGANGKPVDNPLRNVAFQAVNLRTSLYSSIMAFEIATLVQGIGLLLVALGIAVGGTGVAFAGLALPKFAAKVHVEPVAAVH